jgi:HTH-type transcriptional regulator / antitoxin HipB
MRGETYSERLGAQVRAQRRLLNLTQTDVAELAGTTQRSVSQVETGKAASLELYAAVCEVVGLELTAVRRRRGSTQQASS